MALFLGRGAGNGGESSPPLGVSVVVSVLRSPFAVHMPYGCGCVLSCVGFFFFFNKKEQKSNRAAHAAS